MTLKLKLLLKIHTFILYFQGLFSFIFFKASQNNMSVKTKARLKNTQRKK